MATRVGIYEPQDFAANRDRLDRIPTDSDGWPRCPGAISAVAIEAAQMPHSSVDVAQQPTELPKPTAVEAGVGALATAAA